MPNHVHLFVETPGANIDRFVGRLSTAYAMYFRYKHDRPGHCFQGRYKSPMVDGDDYIIRLTRYLHLNPVNVKPVEAWEADRKWQYLQGYRWSSLSGYLSAKAAEPFVDYRWLTMFGGGKRGSARAEYARYIRAMIGKIDPVLSEAHKRSVNAIGPEDFVREVEDWQREEKRRRGRADGGIPLVRPPSLDEITQAVSAAFGLKPSEWLRPHAQVGLARAVFVEIACSLAGRSQRDVAQYLGGVTEHAVSKVRKRLRRSPGQWAEAAEQIEKIAGPLRETGSR
jgi:hypothetical protein